jgi:REP element-mobilizing transposase RayT
VEADELLAAIRHWDGIRWDVFAAVVMPDHVHVLACPLPKGDGRWDLGELLHSVKSYSARQIAKAEETGTGRRRGGGTASRRCSSIWHDERYDRWMRTDG